jgi:hypothetical protein
LFGDVWSWPNGRRTKRFFFFSLLSPSAGVDLLTANGVSRRPWFYVLVWKNPRRVHGYKWGLLIVRKREIQRSTVGCRWSL